MAKLYGLPVEALGLAAVVLAGTIAVVESIGRDEVFLSLLGAVGGWLRFKLAPRGQLTLVPVGFFLALLIVAPVSAFLVAVVSTLLAVLTFDRREARSVLREIGQESLPALAAVVLLAGLEGSSFRIFAGDWSFYSMAVATYVAIRLVLGTAEAYFSGGIAPRTYLIGAAKNIAGNLLLLGLVALGIRASLYGQFGYFALILTTIALIEVYHPWKLLSEQNEILFANLAMVAQAIDVKDPYTARHSRNVADTAVNIARAMRLSEEDVRKIRIGALMHDIGKIGVSSSIIRKPSGLEPAEISAMRKHPVISADIMQPIGLLADAAEIVRHHHEHFDGTGYPDGLKGDRIPLGSRVILVADAFDAMTTDRPYRRGRSWEEALRVLKEHAGSQFDDDVVRALEKVVHLALRYSQSRTSLGSHPTSMQ